MRTLITLITLGLLVITLAASPAPEKTQADSEPSSGPQAAAAATPLGKAVNGIWQDAEVATDPSYVELFKRVKFILAAPADMRQVMVNWPLPRQMRGGKQALDVTFKDKHVTFSWIGTIAAGEESPASLQRFQDSLKKQGYQPLDQTKRPEILQQLINPVHESREFWTRTINETELLVSFESSRFVGSDTYRSGLTFTWFLRRPWQLPPPALSDALATLPAWMKPKYLDEKFFEIMGREPVLQLSGGSDFSMELANQVVDQLIKGLESTGFEYESESSPNPNGSISKWWSRFADSTPAQITTSADGKQLRFTCQVPLRIGAPLKGKRPPVHPSFKLPIEKRPILTLDQLDFDNTMLQQQAQMFHEMAEQMAGENWQVQSYRDERYTSAALYCAKWETTPKRNLIFLAKERPYQGMIINLEGRRDSAEKIGTLTVRGSSVPRAGWSAMLSYRNTVGPKATTRPEITAWVELVMDHENPVEIARAPLTGCSVSASEKDGKLEYNFRASSGARSFQDTLHMLYDTPEALRDGVLLNISELRQTSRELIRTGKATTVADYSYVRSDNPPRREPTDRHPPSDAIKQSFERQVEYQLAEQEAFIREHYKPIHAAIQRAMPLADKKQLLLDHAAASPSQRHAARKSLQHSAGGLFPNWLHSERIASQRVMRPADREVFTRKPMTQDNLYLWNTICSLLEHITEFVANRRTI